MKILPLILFLSLASAPAFAACGITPTCADVQSSFVGVVISEGFRLGWSTSHEDATIGTYKLLRYPAGGDPESAVPVGQMPARKQCAFRLYGMEDHPDNPISGNWSYRIEAWEVDAAAPTCHADFTP